MSNQPVATDPRILARFSIWKLSFFCGFLIASAALCWLQIPGLDEYVGHRYPTEFGRFLLISATVIFTVFLPLAGWHAWNFLARPGALYVSNGRLYIYWAYFQSVAVEDIKDALRTGPVSRMGDSVRVSLNGRRDLTFQTTFMAMNGDDVAAAIRKVAATHSSPPNS